MSTDSSKPFYYENQFFVIRVHSKDVQGDWFVGPRNSTVFDVDCARQFSTAAEASRVLVRLPKNVQLYEIEAVTQQIGPIVPIPKFIAESLENIPFPYYLVAYEWYCGGDVKTWLMTYRSKSTYYRHHKKLMEHGIDISKPSPVVILGEKSYCQPDLLPA